MVSSLAAQLAKGASLNTNALVDRSRRKATESYLFTGRDADKHDLDTIHALGLNAFRQLCTLSPKLDEYEGPLFSDSARSTDRTMLPRDELVQLDAAIDGLLPLLGPYLTEGATGRALEWLVRRFRINEFNVDAILALFLPYHESPHFAKMLSVLHLKPNSTWSFLIPFKSAAQPVPRPPLVTELLKQENSDARRFIVALLPSAIKGNYVHHTLLAFNAATLHDYLIRAKSLDEGTLAHLLPALMEPLQDWSETGGRDAILGSYILLSALSQCCRLQPQALKTILHAMSHCARRVDTKQFINAALSVCEAQDELDALTDKTYKNILKLSNIKEELRTAEKWVGIEKLYIPLITTACSHIDTDDSAHSLFDSIIGSPTAPPSVVKHLTSLLLTQDIDSTEPSLAARRFLSHIAQLHPDILQAAADAQEDEQHKEQIDSLIVSLSAPQASELLQSDEGNVLGSLSADERVRAAAVTELLKTAKSKDEDDPELKSICAALLARVQDTSMLVLKALYADTTMLRAAMSDPHVYLDNLALALQAKPKRQALQLQIRFLTTITAQGGASLEEEDIFHKILFPFLLFSKTRQHSAEIVWSATADSEFELLKGEENKMERINEAVSVKLAENIMASNQFSAHLNAFVRKLQDSDPHVRVLAYLIVRALLYLGNANLHRMAVHKVTSKSTTHWLQVSILALIPTIPRPSGLILDWFTDDSDSISASYVKLQRAVYKSANSTSRLPHVTIGLLSALFVSLKDDALAFLAGLCVTGLHLNNTEATDNTISIIALRHAMAFLEAHKAEADGVDFQTILPALVVCLTSADAEIRVAALDCLAVLNGLAEQKFSVAQLQYLSQADLKRVFHAQHLMRSNGEKKKESEYKHRVLCYLLSHVGAISLPFCAHRTTGARTALRCGPGSTMEQFASLTLLSFDTSAAANLNDSEIFSMGQGSSPTCRKVLLHNLEQGLLAGLSIDRKVDVCTLLLDVGTTDTEMYLPSKKVLSIAFNDIPLVIRLLSSTNPSVTESPRASKRARLTEISDDTLPRLSLLAEVLASIPLPGSIEFVSRLLDTLHNVVQSSTQSDIDISYIEQSLMSAVEHAAEKITEIPNLAPSTIHLDILVELIRVADNPQTFNQALLLMATLARLAPDSVLRNVMPVFTFMGSNVFHRDDSYSFQVVQKTVDSIVPVMVSSLKRSHSARLDLYIASRDFLRVFTDASNHVPRHRRTSFFGHLVDVLGPVDFLAPLCMLLAEKSANRIVRQTPEEVQNLLGLPVFRHSRQILTEILREAQRLVARAIDVENLDPCVLDTAPDDEQQQPTAATFRRRAHALVVFVGHAMKMTVSSPSGVVVPEGGTTSDLVSLLIGLATTGWPARTSLTKALSCMAVVDFVDAVLSILRSQESEVQSGVLLLLSQRLHDVANATRAKITTRINEIIEEMRKLLLAHPDALQSIALTMSPGEEGALTAMVPTLLSAAKAHKMAQPAMSALAPLSCDSITQSSLEVLHGLLTAIPKFWSSAELMQVSKLYIDKYTSSAAPLASLMKAVAKRAPTSILLAALFELWPSVQSAPEPSRVVGYFDLLKRCLRSGARPVVQENVRLLFKIFQEGFDLNVVVIPQSEAEKQAIAAFVDLVVKLNEASFRPLFRKLYDWAFAGETAQNKRKITFCNVYSGLLDYFKGLMNPYMSFLIQSFVTTLKEYSSEKSSDPVLWTCILEIFSKSLIADDGAFWRDDKLRLTTPVLIQQVPVCVSLGASKELVTECLVALADSATDDALLKSLNLDLLMHTRSEDVRLRIFALVCATTLWTAHGGKFLRTSARNLFRL
ncbi:hypothetical protein C8F01DRAFT_1162846 [Mycena amicta]|nr:hypothetical protein C8F01DRAFT_1162846 [Mycena amicta]